MLIFSCVIKHIIIDKNKTLYKLFYTLFSLHNKKVKKIVSISELYPNFISIIL
jgi:hypothetical protein